MSLEDLLTCHAIVRYRSRIADVPIDDIVADVCTPPVVLACERRCGDHVRVVVRHGLKVVVRNGLVVTVLSKFIGRAALYRDGDGAISTKGRRRDAWKRQARAEGWL